jgi:ABC-type branched-subunit amino acid transport system permease subunit
MLTRTASGAGSLVGVVAGAAVMFALPFLSRINGYLYTAIGIAVCFVVGWLASQVLPADRRDLTGLTVFTPGGGGPSQENRS